MLSTHPSTHLSQNVTFKVVSQMLIEDLTFRKVELCLYIQYTKYFQFQILSDTRNNVISETNILELNKRILDHVEPLAAGQYRKFPGCVGEYIYWHQDSSLHSWTVHTCLVQSQTLAKFYLMMIKRCIFQCKMNSQLRNVQFW